MISFFSLLFSLLFCFFDWCSVIFGVLLFTFFVCLFAFNKSFLGDFVFLDSFSFFMLLLLGWIFYLVLISGLFDFVSVGYYSSFSFLFGMGCLSLGFCFCFSNFFYFYFSFEVVFFLFFLLLLIWSYSPERFQASYYMLFYTLLVSFPFLFFVLFYGYVIFTESFFICSVYGMGLGYWWILMVFIFMVKLPVFFIHLWLPKAHVEAPLGGSMVLAGVLLKLGGYGLVRLGKEFSIDFLFGSYFLGLGLVGGLVTCFLCLRQVDFKSMVAYSSVCHMGLVFSGLVFNSTFCVCGSYLIMVFHGLVSSCLFMLLFFLYVRYSSRSILFNKSVLVGAPLLSGWCFVFVSLNMGVPPSLGFFSEILVLGPILLFFFALSFWLFFMFFLVGVYNVYLFCFMSHGEGFVMGNFFELDSREHFLFFSHFVPCSFLVFFLDNLLPVFF